MAEDKFLPVGVDPQNIFKKEKKDHTVYQAVYSGVTVYEMICRNVAVMRRVKDSYLNATQVLKVAQIEKGKRTKILEKEIHNREHEKVQGGYGKYQGTWIPFERGLELAQFYGVDQLLRPLMEYSPPNGIMEKTPTKEQVRGSQKSQAQARKQAFSESNPKRQKIDQAPSNSNCEPEYSLNDPNQSFDFGDSKYYGYNGYYHVDPYAYGYHSMPPPPPAIPVPAPVETLSAERHRASITSLFLNSGKPSYEMLYPHSILPADFDIDLILDDVGHTALHWAAALGNITLLNLLIQKGAQADRLNYSGESALMRAVMVSYCHEKHVFLDLLTVLKETILLCDKKNRTILHHICVAFIPKSVNQASTYYLQCLLEYIANARYDDQLSNQMIHSDSGGSFGRNLSLMLDAQDVCGDTAVNIAARLGKRNLFNQLVKAGANVDIPNSSGLKPSDFGFETDSSNTAHTGQTPMALASPEMCVVYPGIQTEQESSSQTISGSVVENEKSQGDVISELHFQLKEMTKEINKYRREIEPMRAQNKLIPGYLKQIRDLEAQLNEAKQSPGTIATVPERSATESVTETESEVARLRNALAQQKAVETRLCTELVNLRGTVSAHELSCKKIISACCNVPLRNVDELLQPLLEALEGEGSQLDMRIVSGFMSRIRQESGASETGTTGIGVPSEVGSNDFVM